MTARHEFYTDDGTTDKPRCPECEETFLADHEDRLHCGRCGYTEWKGA